ncbi:ATP-binding cassette domain-containing protein [Calidifontibacillus oryziterrae]|uniref:ATP-binding cassette domain-containing protein n=1 Tax=Calidifontibacillus oryziterrae TaxID=1191699 RepID=UPI0002E5472A|nr:ATP-binding cassette domain-containing protein [Calidifontibacillus oryziterrae]
MIHLQDVEVVKKEKSIVRVSHLQITTGKVTGVIGPNGAGKSSLLKVMALLDNPTSGVIKLKQKQVFPGKINIEERRKVSVVFQQPLMLDTTVFNNVAAGLKFRRLPKAIIKEKVQYWLKQFGVNHLSGQRARTLSGGEAQRVSIARAMATEPEVLFLDEPFSALDLPTRRKLLKDFQEIIRNTKTTTIIVSHDYQEIQFLCDEVIIMFEGKMIDKVPVNELMTESFSGDLLNFLKEWMTPLINK